MMERTAERLSLPGRLLVISRWFSPRPGGSSVTLSNLLGWFDPADYLVVTTRPVPDEARSAPLAGAQIQYTSSEWRFHTRGHQLWNTAQIPVAAKRIFTLVKQSQCKAICAVFPDIQYLTTAYWVHKMTGLPLSVYLHDFIVDAHYGGYLGTLARWIQPRIFQSAYPLWTMSEAMSEYLQRTYRVRSEPLVHAYNESIPEEPPAHTFSSEGLRLFFSGAVYIANSVSLARITRAISRMPNVRLTLSGGNNPQALQQQGIAGPHVHSGFIVNRAELIQFMQTQDIFVSCLSWPEESWLGPDELATIFSTKLPEYLAQGKPILIHCPDHYFVARFFKKHDCGWVVSTPSEEAIQRTLQEIQENTDTRQRRCRNALKAARLFEGNRIARQFQAKMSSVINGDSAQKK